MAVIAWAMAASIAPTERPIALRNVLRKPVQLGSDWDFRMAVNTRPISPPRGDRRHLFDYVWVSAVSKGLLLGSDAILLQFGS